MHEDKKTLKYFDSFTPSYSAERFDFAYEPILKHTKSSSKILDIGCGDGKILMQLKQQSVAAELFGMDISPQYLEKASELTGCKTINGSILDDKMIASYKTSFDVCLLGSVLHHMIGKNRKESYALANHALRNAWYLLRPGGLLTIYEPAFKPVYIMDLVFWIKVGFSRVSSDRMEYLGKKWLNVGPPVVSYYSKDQLIEMINTLDAPSILAAETRKKKKIAWVIERARLGLIVKKDTSP